MVTLTEKRRGASATKLERLRRYRGVLSRQKAKLLLAHVRRVRREWAR